MPRNLVAPLIGAVVCAVGLFLLRRHAVLWRQQKNDSSLDELDRHYYYARYRRRMQTSTLLIVVGVLLAAGDALIDWNRFPAIFAFYWGGVLLMLVWVIVLALADMAATTAHSRIALAKTRQKQRALEEQLAEFRRRSGNRNGADPMS